MNARQQAFAEHYAANGNATEAAKAAGYSAKTAYSIGQRLLNNVEVKRRIEELQAELASKRIADIKEIKETLTGVLRNGKERTGDRLKAADALLRSGGAYLPATPRSKPTREERELAECGITGERDEGAVVEIVMPWDGKTTIDGIKLDNGQILYLMDCNTGKSHEDRAVTIVITEAQAALLMGADVIERRVEQMRESEQR